VSTALDSSVAPGLTEAEAAARPVANVPEGLLSSVETLGETKRIWSLLAEL